MNTKRMSAMVTLMVLAMLTTMTVWAGNRDINREFDLSTGGTLVLDLSGADVTVAPGENGKVLLDARIRGSEKFLKDYEVDIDSSADRLAITARKRSKWGWSWGSTSVDFKLTVPRQLFTDIATSGGNLNVRGLEGEHRLRTSGGNVKIERMRGVMDVRTSGGNIAVTECAGPLKLDTSGGNVRVMNVTGGVEARTSGGDIRLLDVSGAIVARTSGGGITIDHYGPNEGMNARTSGGSIRLTVSPEFAGELHARTSGGTVDVEDVEIRLRGKIDRNEVQGAIGGGGPDVVLKTSGGDIRFNARR